MINLKSDYEKTKEQVVKNKEDIIKLSNEIEELKREEKEERKLLENRLKRNIWEVIDILNGECVRLSQGDYEKRQVYEKDPIQAAKVFERIGFKKLHIEARKMFCH